MKKTLWSSLLLMSVIGLSAGCSSNATGMMSEKASAPKCGSGKCGTTGKCGGPGKCGGAGKCGSPAGGI